MPADLDVPLVRPNDVTHLPVQWLKHIQALGIPMLVTEEAYRARPEFLKIVRVCNTLHRKDHTTFVHFAKSLDQSGWPRGPHNAGTTG
ncbi:hypothetical protein WM31_32575 [Burkholderia ubonensis]|nr:hypothetical protein WM31_32575 [Burkholderia ubonensis]